MNKVIGGDYKGSILVDRYTYVDVLAGVTVKLNGNTVKSVQEIRSEAQVSGSSAFNRALVGGAAFAISAKKKYDYIVVITLTDGSEMLCEVDSKMYKKLLGFAFDKPVADNNDGNVEYDDTAANKFMILSLVFSILTFLLVFGLYYFCNGHIK